MKNDVNLLTVRKSAEKNSKKRTYVLLVILFAVVLLAGVVLPTRAYDDAERKLKKLENDLSKLTITEKMFAETTDTAALAVNQRAQLEALYSSRSDILSYLSVIEKSLPQTALLTDIMFSDNSVGISGIAPDDQAIAVFCLRLRNSDMFSSVLVSSSTLLPDENYTAFSIDAVLYKSLSGGAAVEEGEKGTADKTDSDASNKVSPQEDNQ